MKKKFIGGIAIAATALLLTSCDYENLLVPDTKSNIGIQTTTGDWNAYLCTLHLEGGNLYGDDKFYVHHLDDFTLPIPTYRGHKFVGRYDADGNEAIVGLFLYYKDVDFYARWEDNPSVTVTFKDGGTTLFSQAVVSDTYYVAPTLPSKIENGVTLYFVGWADEVNWHLKNGYFPYTYDVTLKAVWSSTPEVLDKSITIAVPEYTGFDDLTKRQIQKYLKSIGENSYDYKINVIPISTMDVLGYIDVYDVDLYVCSHDSLERAVLSDNATIIPEEYASSMKEENINTTVSGAYYDNNLYAYPLSIASGYVMYYDKSLFDGVNLDSLEDIIARLEDTKHQFSYDVRNIYYGAGFFMGTGCESKWEIDENGQFVGYTDSYNSEKGIYALEGMYKLLSSNVFFNSSSGGDFNAANPSGVVVSGEWSTHGVKEILGENYGVAKLPSFTASDGNKYQIGSYMNGNYLCVRPQTDYAKQELLMDLAKYLSSEECQIERYNTFGWMPTNLAAYETDELKDDETLKAFMEQAKNSVAMGAILGDWWEIGSELVMDVLGSKGTKEELQKALDDYSDKLSNTLG